MKKQKSNIFSAKRLLISIVFGILSVITINLAYEIIYYPGRYSLYKNLPLLCLWGSLIIYLILLILEKIHLKLDKYYPWNKNTIKRFLSQLLFDSTTVLIITIPLGLFASKYLSEDNEIDVPDDIFIIGGIVIFYVFIYSLMDLSRYFFNRWKDSLNAIERYRTERVRFQFDRLKEQLNPHFLFNNLNILYSLINDNTEVASEFVLELSDIYRYVLKNTDEEVVDLKEELDFTKCYVFLISKRFPASINIQIQLSEEIYHSKIPPLTLQMLIENAIKHNSFDKEHPLNLNILHNNSDKKIIIENNLQPKIKTEETNKIGLINLNERYRFLSRKEIEIIKINNKFTVKLPVI